VYTSFVNICQVVLIGIKDLETTTDLWIPFNPSGQDRSEVSHALMLTEVPITFTSTGNSMMPNA